MTSQKHWLLVLLLLCLLLPWGAQAETLSVTVPVWGGSVEIQSTLIENEHWLFLPSGVKLERIALHLPDGSTVPFPQEYTEDDGVFSAVLDGLSIRAMRSENIRSFFFFSDDPVNYGRSYIDEAFQHSTRTSGFFALLDDDACMVHHAGRVRTLRGRGNGTWTEEKKPYQFKLEDRTNLLDTGNPDERSRTWILLALSRDGTYLHDRITFDLARELGDTTASASEHVNLYYDGEYRGLYLLCEKTEIGEGRIDVLDYDKLIEGWNDSIGQYDLEALPAAKAVNRYGNEFSYIEGVAEAGMPSDGSFLLEMESVGFSLTDRCWFSLSDGSVLASKNPENATESMMRYISEYTEEARQTLAHRGVHPETGLTLEEAFDVKAFALSALISDFSGNLDSYHHSSTYFVLPAGQKRFLPGPPWDYDLAYRYLTEKADAKDASGFHYKTGWLPDFYSCRVFRKELQALCSEAFPSAIEEILLGTEPGHSLRPLDDYIAEIDAARRMNEKIWPIFTDDRLHFGDSFEEEIALLRSYLRERCEWLCQTVLGWPMEDAETIEIWSDAPYVHIDGSVRFCTQPWSNAKVVSFDYEQLTEATEERYALWQMNAVLAPTDGLSFVNPAVTVNGTPVEAVLQTDGTLLLSFAFEDPSYRPVDAYGTDIGLVYDYETYIARYPEVAEACDYDPELVMDYFLYDGMYEGHQGNAFFYPPDILLNNRWLGDMYGEDWSLYYMDYAAFGYTEWSLPKHALFDLKPLPLPAEVP